MSPCIADKSPSRTDRLTQPSPHVGCGMDAAEQLGIRAPRANPRTAVQSRPVFLFHPATEPNQLGPRNAQGGYYVPMVSSGYSQPVFTGHLSYDFSKRTLPPGQAPDEPRAIRRVRLVGSRLHQADE